MMGACCPCLVLSARVGWLTRVSCHVMVACRLPAPQPRCPEGWVEQPRANEGRCRWGLGTAPHQELTSPSTLPPCPPQWTRYHIFPPTPSRLAHLPTYLATLSFPCLQLHPPLMCFPWVSASTGLPLVTTLSGTPPTSGRPASAPTSESGAGKPTHGFSTSIQRGYR